MYATSSQVIRRRNPHILVSRPTARPPRPSRRLAAKLRAITAKRRGGVVVGWIYVRDVAVCKTGSSWRWWRRGAPVRKAGKRGVLNVSGDPGLVSFAAPLSKGMTHLFHARYNPSAYIVFR